MGGSNVDTCCSCPAGKTCTGVQKFVRNVQGFASFEVGATYMTTNFYNQNGTVVYTATLTNPRTIVTSVPTATPMMIPFMAPTSMLSIVPTASPSIYGNTYDDNFYGANFHAKHNSYCLPFYDTSVNAKHNSNCNTKHFLYFDSKLNTDYFTYKVIYNEISMKPTKNLQRSIEGQGTRQDLNSPRFCFRGIAWSYRCGGECAQESRN